MTIRNLIFLDFETTGVVPETAYPLEVAAIAAAKSGLIISKCNLYIKPPNDIDITDAKYAKAMKVNGITPDVLASEGKNVSRVVADLATLIIDASLNAESDKVNKPIVVSDNPLFDIKMLEYLWKVSKADEWLAPLEKLLYHHAIDMWTASKLLGKQLYQKPHTALGDVELLYEYYLTMGLSEKLF